MTRTELVEHLAKLHPQLARHDLDVAVRILLGHMSQALAAGDRVEIRGFGAFTSRRLPARIGRNPKTGETVAVPTRHRVHFKPGKALRERVDAAN